MTAWNEQLRQHRLRRGLTQEEVAAELARVAWEQNHAHVGVDGAMVSKWECGRKQPSRTYRRLIASVFGDEQLAFVGPDDLADLGLEFARSIADAVETVDTLARADMERRAFLQSALFGVAASAVPSRDWLLATIEEAGSPAKRIGAAQVEAIRRTFGIFHELDVTRGGGHARHQLAGYFTSSVVPLLRSNDASTDAGRELYEAGAEHVRLIGWMAFDDGESALAQRYFIQGLRLAHEARSPELGAYILTGLSHQAITAGRPDQGLQLTRAGRAGLRHGHSPACLADLWALQARAEAAMGDHRAAAHSVAESERAAETIHAEEGAGWARFIDGAYLNGEYANAFRDLDRPDETTRFATVSAAEAQRQQRARRGCQAHATLARAALTRHDLEAAAMSGAAAVRLAVTVQSSRTTEAVADLRFRLGDHAGSPPVAEFLDLADALLPPKSRRKAPHIH